MALLTNGLVSSPLGEVSPGEGSPSAFITGGLGRSQPQTAHPNWFNTPIVSFNFFESEISDTNVPGSVRRANDGSLLNSRFGGEGPFAPRSSRRPYTNYGTTFGEPAIADFASPTFSDRMGKNGDLEYAVWNGDPKSMYNARSLTLYTPERLGLSPRSLSKFRYIAKLLRPMGVVLRVIKEDSTELLIDHGLIHDLNQIVEVIDGVRHTILRDRRYDIVSEQEYTGMGE